MYTNLIYQTVTRFKVSYTSNKSSHKDNIQMDNINKNSNNKSKTNAKNFIPSTDMLEYKYAAL